MLKTPAAIRLKMPRFVNVRALFMADYICVLSILKLSLRKFLIHKVGAQSFHIFAPHSGQNLQPSGNVLPQEGQRRVRLWPHS